MPSVTPVPAHIALATAALVFVLPAAPVAQTKDAFVSSLIEFTTALEGTTGSEGPAVLRALDSMGTALKQWDDAVRGYEARLAAEAPKAPPAAAAGMHATMAVIYLDRGRLEDGLRQLDAAVRLGLRDASVHRLRALALDALGRNREAAAARATAEKLGPALPPFPTIGLVDDGAADAPLFPLARYADGFTKLAARQYGAALTSWRAAAATDPLVAANTIAPGDERIRIRHADALMAAGRTADAESALKETIRALPRSGRARWRLARLYQLQQREEALAEAEAAAAAGPLLGAAHVYALIGYLHHTRFDLDPAARAYQRRVALAPNDASARRDLADVFLAQDRHADALREFSVALALRPDDARAHAGAGHAHVAAGRDETAMAAFRRAVELDPRLRDAHYALGRALLRAGRGDEAKAALATFERLQAEALEADRRARDEEVRRAEQALEKAGGSAGSPR